MTQKDYNYNRAVDLWVYSGIVLDGYIVVDGTITEEGDL